MKRRFFDILAVGSLVIFVGVVVLGGRQWRNSFRVFGDRYSCRIDGGRLFLHGPPSHGSVEGRARAADWAASLTNDGLEWKVFGRFTDDGFRGGVAPMNARRDTGELLKLARLDRDAFTREFLRALDDPERIGAAHLALSLMHRTTRDASARQEGDRVLLRYDGLEAVVPASELASSVGGGEGGLRMVTMMHGPGLDGRDVRIDPAQIPRIRERWHDLLDVGVVVVPLWTVAALSLVVPLGWARRQGIRVVRRRRGWCVACGYDLRATPGRCPECGAITGGSTW